MFPNLLPFAKKNHQNAAASTTPERIFSYFGRVWSKERNKLSTESACNLTFALANLKLASSYEKDQKKKKQTTRPKMQNMLESSSSSAATVAAAAVSPVAAVASVVSEGPEVINLIEDTDEKDEIENEDLVVFLEDDDEDDDDADTVELPQGGVAQLNIGEESAKLEEEIRCWIDASNEI